MGLTQKLGTIPLAILTDASNNVGIGAAPSGSYKLEVTGTGAFSSSLQAVSLVATGGLNSGLIAANTSFIDNSSATARFLSYGANSSTRGAFSFIQASSTNTLQQVPFVIDTSGNAGFGSSTIYNGGGFQKVISFYSPSSLALTYASDTQQYQVGIASNDYRVYDFTGSTYRFVIKGTTGNVVIGDTTDTGYKLQVNGTTSTGSLFLNAPADGFAMNLIGAARFGNVSSATINLTTVFPSNSFTSKGISVMLQIVSASSSSNTLSCIWNLVRTGAGTWTSSAINQITNGITITSITGSGTTITINFSGGAQYGTVNISVSTYA